MATMFPNELWMSIFEELDSPKDVFALVRTSKRFNSFAIKTLYRNVVWLDPLKFVRNHPFLQQDPSLLSLTRSLTLGLSTSTPQSDHIEQISRARGVVFLSGIITPINRPTRGHEARILDEAGVANSVDLLADIHVTNTMYNHALTMTNLRDLTFDNMLLPDSFYAFIHRFPQLDRLAIENCTPPLHPQSTLLHPRDLPITELTILGLRGRREPRELRAFVEAQRLRIVRFDWTCYLYRHFWAPPSHNPNWAIIVNGVNLNAPPIQQQIAIPTHLNPVPSPYIHTIDVKFPTQKLWQSYVSEPHDHIILPFADFLSKCPRVTNLRVRNHLPWLRLSNTALPNLVYYQGPLTTIKPIVYGSRRLKHLAVRDPAGGLVALAKAFKEIETSGAGTGLESLSVFIASWDDEILYAILHHFSGLKRLEVMYKEGDPTEEMVLGMGAHFFGLMPHLWSVRVFKVVDNINVGANRTVSPPTSVVVEGLDIELLPEPAEMDDPGFEEVCTTTSSSSVELTLSEEESEETLEFIQAWNRYCPTLREVQLKPGYVWRRVGPNDTWAQRATNVNRVRNAGFEEV